MPQFARQPDTFIPDCPQHLSHIEIILPVLLPSASLIAAFQVLDSKARLCLPLPPSSATAALYTLDSCNPPPVPAVAFGFISLSI
jgi:hypothetical protein